MGIKNNEKRKATRYNIEFLVSIFKDNICVSQSNNVKDMSVLGCLIVVTNQYKFGYGDSVVLKMEEEKLLKEFNLVLDPIEANVKHIKDNFLIGLEFKNITEKNKKILNDIIEKKYILKKFPKSWQISK